MRRSLILILAGCVEMKPSGRPFTPVDVTETPAASAPEPKPAPEPQGPQGDFDFEQDARETSEPVPEPTPVEEPAPSAPVAAPVVGQPVPVWDPSKPLPQASFGVRVLAVVLDVQPPRAMLALPDGREIVVQPGTMLPDAGLVVLAIGRDAVQVAKVTPAGYYATVQTDTVQAMYAPAGTISDAP